MKLTKIDTLQYSIYHYPLHKDISKEVANKASCAKNYKNKVVQFAAEPDFHILLVPFLQLFISEHVHSFPFLSFPSCPFPFHFLFMSFKLKVFKSSLKSIRQGVPHKSPKKVIKKDQKRVVNKALEVLSFGG